VAQPFLAVLFLAGTDTAACPERRRVCVLWSRISRAAARQGQPRQLKTTVSPSRRARMRQWPETPSPHTT